MGHSQRQQHPAVDNLVNTLTRANHDLTLVHYKLDKEFQQLYPHNANPMKLVSRINKIQEDVVALKDQCRQLLLAKQDLIDKARTILVGNRSTLQRMQPSLGISTLDDAHDPAFANFNQVVDEWATQVRTKTTGEEVDDSEPEDVNKLLFSAIVQGS
ncbi:hypothetical protein ACFE04_024870 [Oxalis oulophora]